MEQALSQERQAAVDAAYTKARAKMFHWVCLNRSGFDRGSIIWKGRVRYAKAIPEGRPGPG
ncbi:hypothetical protein ACIA98_41280, partial [Streptomyces sp. NPDC051366]|uniref:hypothetical protein n=1 Tax=Streptomyces sp. NPDC051366 TaxID=3365652 RepID=UPI00378C2B10